MKGSRIVITGGAGFIGSHLAERLAGQNEVRIVDDFSSGLLDNIKGIRSKVKVAKKDISNLNGIKNEFKGCDTVFHFAANPDVSLGSRNNSLHLTKDVVGTYNVLESARLNDVDTVVFASSSTVYGEAKVIPTREDYSPMLPISFYGASKLAGEAYMSAFSDNYGMRVVLLRFANIIGPRNGHGVVYNFVKQMNEKGAMTILSDGSQKKSYLYVDDCVNGSLIAANKAPKGCSAYNVGSEDSITVMEIARTVAKEMGMKARFVFGSNWAGDVHHFELSVSKLKKLGWRPACASAESVRLTAKHLIVSGSRNARAR